MTIADACIETKSVHGKLYASTTYCFIHNVFCLSTFTACPPSHVFPSLLSGKANTTTAAGG